MKKIQLYKKIHNQKKYAFLKKKFISSQLSNYSSFDMIYNYVKTTEKYKIGS